MIKRTSLKRQSFPGAQLTGRHSRTLWRISSKRSNSGFRLRMNSAMSFLNQRAGAVCWPEVGLKRIASDFAAPIGDASSCTPPPHS